LRLFSYRNRRRFRKVFLVLLVLALIFAVVTGFTIAYLERYLVYDRNGAHIDPNWNEAVRDVPVYSTPGFAAELSYVSDTTHAVSEESAEVTGFYVTAQMLADIEGIRQNLSGKTYNAVLFDLKDGYGNFYYNSVQGNVVTSYDVSAITALIQELKSDNVYLIARIPAFADRNYCLANVDVGLPLASGALWVDDNNCYWMDPGDEKVISRIESVCIELQQLGFREVVLDNFHFPDSQYVVYDETERTKSMVLSDCITRLQNDLGALGLMISTSFPTEQAFPGEHVTGRLYFKLNSGANVDSVAETHAASVSTPSEQIVFVTESHDTRFNEYGVLMPALE